MSEFINASICVTDIPKDRIRQAENGKKYINICIASRRETDQYGNTHTIYMGQTKEEREAKVDRVYVGSGKGFNPQPVTAESVNEMPPAQVDDLPF